MIESIKEKFYKVKKTSFYQLLTRFSILLVLFAIFSITTSNFIQLNNLLTITLQVALYAVLACGMAFVLVVGSIDLSVGSIAGLSGIVCAILLRDFGMSIPLTILISLVVGVICGFINGLMVTNLKLPAFIATLGTMWIYRGVVQLLADGQPVTIRNQDNPEVAEFFKMLGSGRIWGNIPVAFIIMIILAVILSIVLNKTVFGRNLFATGSNSEAARLSGINVKWTTIYAHMIAGIMAGIAGILITGRLSSGQVNAGSGYELEAVAACAIGRVSLLGGEGSIIGALIGAFMMGILRNGLNLNGVGSFWQQIVIGIVLIVAVTTDLYQRKRIGQ